MVRGFKKGGKFRPTNQKKAIMINLKKEPVPKILFHGTNKKNAMKLIEEQKPNLALSGSNFTKFKKPTFFLAEKISVARDYANEEKLTKENLLKVKSGRVVDVTISPSSVIVKKENLPAFIKLKDKGIEQTPDNFIKLKNLSYTDAKKHGVDIVERSFGGNDIELMVINPDVIKKIEMHKR